MAQLSDSDRQALLRLARTSITAVLVPGTVVEHPGPSSAIDQLRGCFVTLHRRSALRGCIGTIEAIDPLRTAVAENARNAAFHDPRFSPLQPKELAEVDIEISVLTPPVRVIFSDGADLKRQLQPGRHGVIVSRGHRRSTFLPQVWEQLPDPDVFLAHLCRKAGMNSQCWQSTDTRVDVYEVEYFSEKGGMAG
jgi:AmmeMemoRadiSam system protein A